MFTCDAEFVRDQDGNMYIKEYALAEVVPEGIRLHVHELVKRPCFFWQLSAKSRQSCTFLRHHTHQIHFYSGLTPLQRLKEMVQECVSPGDVIFTKGEEKARVLEEALGVPTMNIDALPPLGMCDVTVSCPFNHSPIYCSKRKVIFYGGWFASDQRGNF